jgi:hypothetical protein
MNVIYEETFGPFSQPTAIVFRDLGEGRIAWEWMPARKVKRSHLTKPEITVFRFAVGTAALVILKSNQSGQITIVAEQFSLTSPLGKDGGGTKAATAAAARGGGCVDLNCDPVSISPCPVGKPNPKCVNGVLTCVSGERPTKPSK